ncbi:PDZ domain-containing protein [bacterium]|nr:PDZ domain-containing protein [bacterium]
MEKLFSVLASGIPFFVLIGVVVTVHELGHYWAGRMFGAAAESFSIGFGRPVVQVRDRRGTRWRVNWLPLGGFVKFAGEAQTAQDLGKVEGGLVGRVYTDLSPWERMVVSLGGPAANFVFAILVAAALAMTLGVAESSQVRVGAVNDGSPAAAAGFEPGDVFVRADGREVRSPADVQLATRLSGGEEVSFVVVRDGAERTIKAVPGTREERDEALKTVEKVGYIGIALETSGVTYRRYGPIEAIGHGTVWTGQLISMTVKVLGRIATGRDGIDQMRGPVGIFNVADNLTDYHMKGEGTFLQKLGTASLGLLTLAALFSVGVGFFNLLPIPVLDGGAVIMCLYEGVTGKPVSDGVQRVGLTIGLATLVAFALVVTLNDLLREGGPLELLSRM